MVAVISAFCLVSTYPLRWSREADALFFQSLYCGTEEAELWIFLEVFCPLYHQCLQFLAHLRMSLQYKNKVTFLSVSRKTLCFPITEHCKMHLIHKRCTEIGTFTYFAQHSPHFTGKLPWADFQVKYFATVRHAYAQQLWGEKDKKQVQILNSPQPKLTILNKKQWWTERLMPKEGKHLQTHQLSPPFVAFVTQI